LESSERETRSSSHRPIDVTARLAPCCTTKGAYILGFQVRKMNGGGVCTRKRLEMDKDIADRYVNKPCLVLLIPNKWAPRAWLKPTAKGPPIRALYRNIPRDRRLRDAWIVHPLAWHISLGSQWDDRAHQPSLGSAVYGCSQKRKNPSIA